MRSAQRPPLANQDLNGDVGNPKPLRSNQGVHAADAGISTGPAWNSSLETLYSAHSVNIKLGDE